MLILITLIAMGHTSFEKLNIFISKSQMGWGLESLGGFTDFVLILQLCVFLTCLIKRISWGV